MLTKKSYAVDEPMPTDDEVAMTEGDTTPTESGEMKGEAEDDGETAMISASALGGKQVKPGQSITLRVVSVDEDGNVVVRSDKKETGGIAEAMNAFKEKE